MASSGIPSFRYFTVDLSVEYVAQVQINRPDKLNAFFEEYGVCDLDETHTDRSDIGCGMR